MRATFSLMSVRFPQHSLKRCRFLSCLLVVAMGVLHSGCVSQTARISVYIESHPDLHVRVRNALLERAVCTGMSKEQCRLILPAPDNVRILGNRTIAVRDRAHEAALRQERWVHVGKAFGCEIYNSTEGSRQDAVGSTGSRLSGYEVWEYVRLESSKKKWRTRAITPKPWESGPGRLSITSTRESASLNAIRVQLIFFRDDMVLKINEDRGMLLGDSFLEVRLGL